MKLVLFLLKASWRTMLSASVIGGISGAASVAMFIFCVLRGLREAGTSPASVVGLFVALCLTIFLTRIVSQVLLSRLTQGAAVRLRLGLCEKILASPLARLEEIGLPGMFVALNGDVNMITRALNGVPMLVVNAVTLAGGFIYLGVLSLPLLGAVVLFWLIGVASYCYVWAIARPHLRRTREAEGVLAQHFRELIDGVKEMKMHQSRRTEFVERALRPALDSVSHAKVVCDCLFDATLTWGRLWFFIAIGLLMFGWAKWFTLDGPTLTRYVFTIFYILSPVEQIMAWLPLLGWAENSVRKIERLGLMLEHVEPDGAVAPPIPRWERIELRGVTHAYRREGQTRGFVLGPVELAIHPGEILFVVGGNGSGKTTLAKLITGLYAPESGEVRLDGETVTAENRESYRQLFSTVFDDPAVFDHLWGLPAAGLDERAGDYLRQLELTHVVSVKEGVFSTTRLSRGQRKRLALLTAYLEDRPIYLFDEWAADQDPVFRRIFYLQLLPELKRRGKTVVAVTHDDRYFAEADCVIKLEEGKIVRSPALEPQYSSKEER